MMKTNECTFECTFRLTDKKVIVDFLNAAIVNQRLFDKGGIDKYTERLATGLNTIQAKSMKEVAGIVSIFAAYNRDVITITNYKIGYSTRSKKATIDYIDIIYTINVGISKNDVEITDENVDDYEFSLVPRYCTIGDAFPEGVKDELIDLDLFMGFDLHVEKKGE